MVRSRERITSHFWREEFDSRDPVTGVRIPYPLVWIAERLLPLCRELEVIRAAIGEKPIVVTAGYRTPEHNRAVGGARKSFHLTGIAADIVGPPEVPAAMLGQIVRELMGSGLLRKGGIGIAADHVHYDIRGKMVVWHEK